ncbi:hypothetical protein OE88DRAFT_24025 [Heliocybe sulcata]|uniref:Uncharacterized protein n=1 Tax=Heliocybe sulcata TaxID=5364 RepID=A0A5C3NHU0_9AGAM|nr:hypothetical protein OE88DRAFT_24025 [Heliocybe sulcata]
MVYPGCNSSRWAMPRLTHDESVKKQEAQGGRLLQFISCDDPAHPVVLVAIYNKTLFSAARVYGSDQVEPHLHLPFIRPYLSLASASSEHGDAHTGWSHSLFSWMTVVPLGSMAICWSEYIGYALPREYRQSIVRCSLQRALDGGSRSTLSCLHKLAYLQHGRDMAAGLAAYSHAVINQSHSWLLLDA